jgi:hypothetical protein
MGGYRRGGQRREPGRQAGRLQKRRKKRLEQRRTGAYASY